MKFSILALDYDGTIARDGMLDQSVKAAIEDARDRGITVVLVTGRILSDLRRYMSDLRLFDAIVAENGAVLAFPNSGRSTILGHPPQPAFLQELNRRGIETAISECVVEADADEACRILSFIREMELPLVVLFNRGRLMVLPQAISKATGLHEALTAMRLSVHNAIAIGDAENDHQLLEACEMGLAVGWGSEALKAVADGVIEGQGPEAVADYIREVTKNPRLSPNRTGRRRLLLGTGEDGRPLELAVRGRNLLIAGDTLSGKSWVAGLICEQLILNRYCVCVIDPEGDYTTLESLPGVILLGGNDPPPQVRELTRALRYPDVSLVIDLSKLRPKEKREYVNSLLLTLAAIRRETGLPHRIVVDEAHYFMHGPEVIKLLDLELAGYTAITYRMSDLHPEVLASSEAIIVTRETDPNEVRALYSLVGRDGTEAEWEDALSNLAMDEAVLLPNTEEARGRLCRFHLAPRLTSHVRHQHKYLDVPVPDGRAFSFTRKGEPIGRRARSLKELTAALAVAPPEMIDGHLRNNDFSRWVKDVFRDSILASEILKLEEQYQLGQMPDINDALIHAIHERYTVSAE